MKLSDIILSLFVEFCIALFVTAFTSSLLLPYFPREILVALGAVLLLWAITIPAIILTGAGWKRGLNKAGLVVLLIIGWFYFAAGWLSCFGSDLMAGSFVVTFFLFAVGFRVAYSKWIDKFVIIKRNPEFDEEPGFEEELEQLASSDEPLGELFG